MLYLKNISFRSFLQNINLNIEAGERVLLTGKNAIGKTTLLRVMAGICLPTGGEVVVDSKQFVQPMKFFEIPRYVRELTKLAMYSEFNTLTLESLTVEQNITLFTMLSDVDKEKITDYITVLDMSDHMSKPLKNISLGTKSKISALYSLICRKQLLLLDEPTLGMDSDVTKRYLDELFASGKTIVISSHQLEYTNDFTKHIVISTDGLTEEG